MKSTYTDKNGSLPSGLFSLKGFALLLLAVLTLSISSSLIWNIMQQREVALESARIHARTALDKDVLFRRWNTLLGGVYAPVTDATPPNPYLEGVVNERDIKTSSSRELTLINPAYMTRQVHELGAEDNGVLGHITSLKPIRPENAADTWERDALLQFEKGVEEVSSIEVMNGREYMRLMRPLITEDGCLKCHERQGYKKGEIRGGISVSVPMESLRVASAGNFTALFFGHIFLWLCGIAAIYVGYRLRKNIEEGRRQAEDRLRSSVQEWRTTFDSITDLVSVHDNEYRIIKCNKAFADFFRKRPEEFVGKHCYELVHGLSEPVHECPHIKMMKTGKTEISEIFDEKHGLYLMVTASPILDNGEIKGIVHYMKDITERKKHENMLTAIAEKISAKTGSEYFEAAVKFITDEIGCEYGLIGELDDSLKKVKTVSLCAHGNIVDNIEYSLSGAPCENVAGQRFCVYPEKIQELFSEDKMLVEMKAESYVGMPLFAPDGGSIGIIALVGCRPLDEKAAKKAESLLYIFASRASAEIKRSRDEVALAESEEKFRAIYDNATDGILLADLQEKKFLTGNAAICSMLGYSLDEIKGMGVMNIHPEKDLPYVIQQFEMQARKEIMLAKDIPIKRKDGTVFYADINSSLVTLSGGKYLIGIFRDMTERRRANEALIESENSLRESQVIAGLGSYVLDLSTGLWTSSDVLDRIFGIDEAYERSVEGWAKLLHPEDRTIMVDYFKNEVLGQGKPFDREYRIIRRNDHAERWVHGLGKLEFDAQGHILKMHGTIQDITGRRQTEEKLRYSEENLRILFDSSVDAIFILDMKGNFMDINRTAYERLGYTKDEMLSMNVSDLDPPEFAVNVPRRLAQIKQEGYAIFESAHYRKDKSIMPVEVNSRLLDYKGQEVFFSVIRDITERKESEKKLVESEKKFRDMAEVSLVGIYLIQDGIFRYCNNKLAEIFGYAAEELIDKKGPEDLVHPDDWHIVRENLRRRIEGEVKSLHYSFRCITKDQATIYVDVYGAKTDYMGRPAVQGTLLDITSRKLAEDEKDGLNRELEQILYAASHDLKSPLVNISGYSSELGRALDDIAKAAESKEKSEAIPALVKEVQESFRFIGASVGRMDSLLNGLLHFSRSGRAEMKEEDINMNMLIKEISDSIDYKVRKAGANLQIMDLHDCIGDREQISRIFTNLIENAVKYLDPARKGEIKVTGYTEDDFSVYCVEDNGIGIAKEHQGQIFRIFHQLDPSKTGEGLGLAIVHRITERHGGKVWLESEKGKGSRFYVKLPGKTGTKF